MRCLCPWRLEIAGKMLMPEMGTDQAAGLRRMVNPQPVRVIAVASGKGGVGKTSISVNLAVGMALNGKRVMLMDADLGLANIDVMLGLQPRYNLSHVISGERTLEEILVEGPAGINIVPASSGVASMANLSPAEHAGLVRAFSDLGLPVDVLIVDTPAGISDSVISFSRAAHDVLIVVCDEPASITDAYAVIKVLSREHGLCRFHMLANMARGMQQGRELFGKMSRVTDRFLDVSLDYMGAVPIDESVYKSVQKQQAVVEAYPSSQAARTLKRLAQQIDRWPMPAQANGQLEFFVERLIQSGDRPLREVQ